MDSNRRRGLNGTLAGLLQLLFPPRCVLCRTSAPESLCGACLASLPLIKEPVCAFCGKPTLMPVDRCRECRGRRFAFTRARSAGAYEGSLRKAIHSFKFGRRPSLAGPFAELMNAALPEADLDLVSFVPLWPRTESRRGYNQSLLLARGLSRERDLPLQPLLRKVRATAPQNSLESAARRANVRDAFEVMPPAGDLRGRRVLLVDDVLTTGATAGECARRLKRAGAREVIVLTLARTVKYR